MVRLTLFFILIAAGLIAGPLLLEDLGYVVISWNNKALELNLLTFTVLVVASIILFLTTEWLLKRILALVTGSKHWLGSWSSRRRNRLFNKGMFAIEEGDNQQAVKCLQSVDSEVYNGLDLIALARVEKSRNDLEAAKSHLNEALQYAGSELAARIQLAKIAIIQQRPQTAIQYLADIPEKKQKQENVIQIWAQALVESSHWSDLSDKLGVWKKHLSTESYQHWLIECAKGKFAEIASKEGANSLKQYWLSLPAKTRKTPAYQAAYIQQLMAQGYYVEAEALLVEWQKGKPESALLPLFKQLAMPRPVLAMKKIEQWIKQDEENPELYSILAHLAVQSNDSGLAQRALEKAIQLQPNKDDLLALAHIQESLHNPAQALVLYKQAT